MCRQFRIKMGNLFVVSAPSGAGKTTLCRRLCEVLPDIRHSVSFTTRKIRPGEIDGVHYVFIDEEEFRSMINAGEFLEWATVHGNFYGTPRSKIIESIESGIDVVLDLDVQGARQIKEKYPDSKLIFILPPSMDELLKRLKGRMTDSKEVIRERMKKAKDEIIEYKNYDYVIVNDIFENALEELKSIVIAERSKIQKIDTNWILQTFGL